MTKHIKLTPEEFKEYISYDLVFLPPPTTEDFKSNNRKIEGTILFQEVYLETLAKKYGFEARTHYVGRKGIIYKIKNPPIQSVIKTILNVKCM